MAERADSMLLHRLFEQLAEHGPERIALRQADAALSYGELNERANALAEHLREHGIGRGDIVAMAMARSFDQVTAMLAILKCGAAYLPLEAGDPLPRTLHCLEQANVRLIVADQACDPQISAGRIVIERSSAALFRSRRKANLDLAAGTDDLCYVMFTSGSTGQPKGVMVPHRAVIRLVRDTNYIEIGRDDRVLQFAPLSFDASTFEIWGALLNGATLVLYSGGMLDPNLFARDIREHQVSVLWLTAALFHLIATRYLSALQPVRTLLAGGDVLHAKLINKVLDEIPGITVINGYGPTENTTFTCCHRMTVTNRPGDIVPIGRPITGTAVHVLDETLQPVPPGAVGELFASGPGVALGYLNQAAGCSAFFRDARIAEGTIYRTGDLVRVNANGELEFQGRRDNQIKIRGFRASLEEIQASLLKLDEVTDAAVFLDQGDAGDQQISAYLQVTASHRMSIAEIRQSLARQLPRYMIPDLIHLDTHLPINRNGKIDKHRIRSAPTTTA